MSSYIRAPVPSSSASTVPVDISSFSHALEETLTGPGRIEDLRRFPNFLRLVKMHRGYQTAGNSDLQQAHLASEEGILLREMVDMNNLFKKSERCLREKEMECDVLMNQNKIMRDRYFHIYAKAEQEEEYISNILLKRIQKLKNDKETLAQKYEQEEEYLTNDLMKRIQQLQSERDSMEGKMKTEQTAIIDNLLQTIRRMETEMSSSRKNIDRMRKEKIDQENALENEQELLYNTLGKQMDQLNDEKRKLQLSLQKAFERGFVDTDDVLAATGEQLPLDILVSRAAGETPSFAAETGPSLKDAYGRTLAELNRLRSLLQGKDLQIGELTRKLEYKEEELRARAAAGCSACEVKEAVLHNIGKMVSDYK